MSVITVCNIDPGAKFWLRRAARHAGVSMDEFVRRMIRERRRKEEHRAIPSDIFRRHFGPEHGVELPLPERLGYRPVEFPAEVEE